MKNENILKVGDSATVEVSPYIIARGKIISYDSVNNTAVIEVNGNKREGKVISS